RAGGCRCGCLSLENLPLMPGGSDAHTGELAEHVRDDGACGSLPAFNRSQGFNMLEFDGDLNPPTPCRCEGEAGAGRPCWSSRVRTQPPCRRYSRGVIPHAALTCS